MKHSTRRIMLWISIFIEFILLQIGIRCIDALGDFAEMYFRILAIFSIIVVIFSFYNFIKD